MVDTETLDRACYVASYYSCHSSKIFRPAIYSGRNRFLRVFQNSVFFEFGNIEFWSSRTDIFRTAIYSGRYWFLRVFQNSVFFEFGNIKFWSSRTDIYKQVGINCLPEYFRPVALSEGGYQYFLFLIRNSMIFKYDVKRLRRGSNPQPLVPKTNALPLRHAVDTV